MGIRKIIGGVANIFRGEKIVINKEGILAVLPHRGRMLLLDEVTITDEHILGKFNVVEDVCEGHQFNGQLIFRGVDIVEMAAQTLGIWLAQHPESKGKIAYFRSVSAKFSGMVVPSDDLVIEIPVKGIMSDDKKNSSDESLEESNPRIEISGRPGRMLERAIAENIVARVKDNKKAFIARIELSIVTLNGSA